MRSFDIFDFAGDDKSFTVTLAKPLFGPGVFLPNGTTDLTQITDWADAHCKGDYIILLTSVAFKREADALIFKLKYG